MSNEQTGSNSQKSELDIATLLIPAFVSDFVYPIFLTFLPLLAYELGADSFEVGMVGGATYAIYSFMPFVLGSVSDRYSTKSFFLIASFGLLSVVSFLYFVASSPILIILTRLVEGLSWAMLWPTIDSLVASSDTLEPNRAFSLYNITWSSAASLGPLIGGLLVFYGSYKFTFIVTTALLVGTLIICSSSFLRERKKPRNIGKITSPRAEEKETTNEVISPFKVSRLDFGLYLLATSIMAMSSTIILTFFPSYAHSLGISVILIGTMVFIFGTSRFVFYILTRIELIRSFITGNRRKQNIVFSMALIFLSSSAFLLNKGNLVVYALAFATAGVVFSIVTTIAQIGIIAEATSAKKGAAAGSYESAFGIGACLGPILAGLLSTTSLLAAFYVPVLFSLVAIGVFIISFRFTDHRRTK